MVESGETGTALVLPEYTLDHSRPIIGLGHFSPIAPEHFDQSYFDKTIVERKYALWDYVLRNNLLDSPDPVFRARCLNLLNDKTIFAYNFLRYDDAPVKMTPLQDCILSDTGDRVVFCGSNQSLGKSFTLNVDAATSFLKDHVKNWVSIIVSGSLPQSQYQMDRIKMLLKSSSISYKEEETIDTKTGKRDNTTQVSYTFYASDKKTPLYTNKLICCPHTSSALGYPADELFFDEWDFWENCDQERFLYQVAIPRTFKTGGKIKVYSNPDGREKMMYRIWLEKKRDGSPAWHRYHFNYWDSEGATQAKFDKMSQGMTKQRMESTLLAMFTRTEGSFFSTEEIKDMVSDLDLVQKGDQAGFGRETAWFLDVGSVHDQSMLIGGYVEENPDNLELPFLKMFYVHKYPVGYPLGRVVGIDTSVDTENQDVKDKYNLEEDGWEDYADDNPSVKHVLSLYAEDYEGKKYQPLFGFDATGNAGMGPLLAAAGIEAADIIFSGKKKWHMAQRFQYYVQQRLVKRALERDENTVRGCTFDYQLGKIVVKRAQNQTYRKIHHENENDLDDCFDACIGLLHLIENPDLPSLGFEVIPHAQMKYSKSNAGNKGEHQPENPLEGQYIPKFYDKGELLGWVEQRQKERI